MYIFDPEIPKNMSSERIRKRKCPLHKIKMKVKTVKVEYGLPLFDRLVERPKDKFYPYCGAPVEKCGHYKGDCLQDGVKWHISCICHRQICHRCRLPIYKYKIPSDIYDETNGRCLHVSIVCAWAHRCPDGVQGQLPNSMLIDTRTGIDILTGNKVLDD